MGKVSRTREPIRLDCHSRVAPGLLNAAGPRGQQGATVCRKIVLSPDRQGQVCVSVFVREGERVQQTQLVTLYPLVEPPVTVDC